MTSYRIIGTGHDESIPDGPAVGSNTDHRSSQVHKLPDVPGVELPGRGRATAPRGMRIGGDGEAAARAVCAERAAIRARVSAISGPGQEQDAGAGRGTGGERGVGPGSAAGMNAPSTVCKPGGQAGHGFEHGRRGGAAGGASGFRFGGSGPRRPTFSGCRPDSTSAWRWAAAAGWRRTAALAAGGVPLALACRLLWRQDRAWAACAAFAVPGTAAVAGTLALKGFGPFAVATVAAAASLPAWLICARRSRERGLGA